MLKQFQRVLFVLCVTSGLLGICILIQVLSRFPRNPTRELPRNLRNLQRVQTEPFVPQATQKESIKIKLGAVTAKIPIEGFQKAEICEGNLATLGIQFENFWCHFFVPTQHIHGTHLCRLRVQHLPPQLTDDEITLRAAAYAADARGCHDPKVDLTKDGLKELLGLKAFICSFTVDSVQIVRLPTIKGLLLLNYQDGRPVSASFEYYSDNEQWRGSAIFDASGPNIEQNMHMIREIVSSFQLVDAPSEKIEKPEAVLKCAFRDIEESMP